MALAGRRAGVEVEHRGDVSPVKEYLPPPPLSPFVECLWLRSAADADASHGAAHRILPDGCLDIVFSPRGAVVVGAMTRPLLVPARETVSLLGVRFRPGMAGAFLRVPAAELTDGRAPLEAIWSDGGRVANEIGSALESSDGVSRLARLLIARLPIVSPVPSDVRAAVADIMARGGRTGVARIAAGLGISRQHLARRFAEWVGISPKRLSRVVGLREVLRAARGAGVNWAALAAELGYCDQSHLVAEFRSLTGLTPAGWRSDRPGGSKSPIAPAPAPLP